MKNGSTIFDGETWISPLQYGIVAEDTPAVVPPGSTVHIHTAGGGATVPAATPTDRMAGRIDELTGEKYALKAEVAAKATALEKAEKELAELRAAATKTPPVVEPKLGTTKTAEEIEADIQNRAESMASERAFQATCNGIAEAGVAAHEDFQTIMEGFKAIGSVPPVVISALLEASDAPHEVLYELGKDLVEATRIFSFRNNPVKLALELKKKGDALSSASRTRATPPVKPIAGGGKVLGEVDPSDPERAPAMSSKDWHAAREKQVAARNAR